MPRSYLPVTSRLWFTAAVLLLFVASTQRTSMACIAVQGQPRSVLPFAETIFEGTVVSESFEIDVRHVWKGQPGNKVYLQWTWENLFNCIPQSFLKPGETVFVFANCPGHLSERLGGATVIDCEAYAVPMRDDPAFHTYMAEPSTVSRSDVTELLVRFSTGDIRTAEASRVLRDWNRSAAVDDWYLPPPDDTHSPESLLDYLLDDLDELFAWSSTCPIMEDGFSPLRADLIPQVLKVLDRPIDETGSAIERADELFSEFEDVVNGLPTSSNSDCEF